MQIFHHRLCVSKWFLGKTTQGFFHKSCLICSYFIGSFALSFSQNFALKLSIKPLLEIEIYHYFYYFSIAPLCPLLRPGQCSASEDASSIAAPSVQNGYHSHLYFLVFCQIVVAFRRLKQSIIHYFFDV
jgi:hypothetical protein